MEPILDHWRSYLSLPHRDARRIFHGRGQCYPGLEHVVVDYFHPVLLIACYQEVETNWLQELASSLCSESSVECVVVQRRYTTPTTTEVLFGSLPKQPVAVENGLQYHLNFQAQNVGFFLDMRHVREWCAEHVEGKNILNTFAFTCAFSVVALNAKANQVVNIDMHRPSLRIGQRNHQLNHLDSRQAIFLGHNIFKSWGKLKKLGPYDLIIVDPPMSQRQSFVTEKDYSRVVRRLPSLLHKNGVVLACLNSPYHGYDYLEDLFQQTDPAWTPMTPIPPSPEFQDKNPEQGLKVIPFQFTGLE